MLGETVAGRAFLNIATTTATQAYPSPSRELSWLPFCVSSSRGLAQPEVALPSSQ